MKTTQLLVLVCVLLFAGSVGLRIRSQLGRGTPVTHSARPPTPRAAVLPAPPDPVLNPIVDPAEFASGPRRIVSLAPSITELVCALGMRDRLVGRTPYCHYPPGIEELPEVGALLDTNYEKIKALRPNLVLITQNSTEVARSLAQLQVPYLRVPHDSLEQVYAAIAQVGAACDRPRTALALTASIRAEMARLEQAVARRNAPPRNVLVSLGPLPVPPQAVFAAGPGSFLEGILHLAGHRNAAGEVLKVSHGEIPLEKLRFLNPDIILEFRDEIRPGEMDELYRSWGEIGPMEAIQQRRVRCVGGLEWLSAGPRIAIEFHRLISALFE